MSYFPLDTYTTPVPERMTLKDRFYYNNSIFFLMGFLGVVFRTRRASLNGSYDDVAWAKSSNDIFKLIERAGGRFFITGLDNIRSHNGPVVIVSNHMSILETMIFPGIIAPERTVTFAVKDSLVKHPVFGPIMRSRNPIIMGRENPRQDLVNLVNEGQELIKRGSSVVIFPQSTRRTIFREDEFNSIGVKLAARAGVPVIPVAIKTDFWRNGKIIKDLGFVDPEIPIHMAFGEPMMVNGSGKEEHAQITAFIAKHFAMWTSGEDHI